MSTTIFTPTLRWVVTTPPPAILRRCSGCGCERAFHSAQRFRVNANGRRLDVWLIYRCARCDATFNLTVHTRESPAKIGVVALARYTQNDLGRALEVACDAQVLRAARVRCGPPGGFDVEGPDLRLAPAGSPGVQVRVALLRPGAAMTLRLDRVLARKLEVSRAAIKRALRDGRVLVEEGEASLLLWVVPPDASPR